MRDYTNISDELFNKIRSAFQNVQMADENAQVVQDSEKARIFNFDYVDQDGKNYGSIVLTLLDNTLRVAFSKNITDKLQGNDKQQFYRFLRGLRFFAKSNMLEFKPQDLTRNITSRDIKNVASNSADVKSKTEIDLGESRMYGSAKSSYEKRGPVRLIVRHSKPVVDETRGARARNIHSIFIETDQGERFKMPINNLRYARAMGRHISEGGSLYDEFGQHITKIAEEYTKLRPFVSNMRRRTFEDADTADMVESASNYHAKLKNTLTRLSGHRGYNSVKEAFVPEETLMDDFDPDSLRERFVKKSFNTKLEDALPIVQKAHNMNKLTQQFESWADSITEGTWAIPDNMKKIEKLKQILSKPLAVGVDAMNATGALYNIIGDDELFDTLSEMASDNPEGDCRDMVVMRLNELIQQCERSSSADEKTWAEQMRQHLGGLLDGNGVDTDYDGYGYPEDDETEGLAQLDPNAEDEDSIYAGDEGYEDEGEEPIDEGRKSTLAGREVKIRGDGRVGTVTYVSREPTFSQMVPYITMVSVKFPDGTTQEFRKEMVRPLKQAAADPLDQEVDEAAPPNRDYSAYDEPASAPLEAVTSAIIRRVMNRDLDILKQHGPEAVMQAAREVASQVGDVEEIGSSDVSAWVKMLRDYLGTSVDETLSNRSQEPTDRAMRAMGHNAADREELQAKAVHDIVDEDPAQYFEDIAAYKRLAGIR